MPVVLGGLRKVSEIMPWWRDGGGNGDRGEVDVWGLAREKWRLLGFE